MAEGIQKLDESILFYIQNNLRNPLMDRFMVFVSALGNSGFLWILIAFLLLCQKRYQKCGIPLICSISLSMFFGDNLLKPLIGRIRPCNKYPEISLLIPGLASASFPSGHTMVAFASATVLFHYHRKPGIIAFMAAALIAFSRLYLFVHYPSDILGGIVLGMLTAFLTIFGVEKIYARLPIHQTQPHSKPRY